MVESTESNNSIREKRVGSFTDETTGYGVEIVVSGGKGTKSMGLVLKLPEGEVEKVIGRLRQKYSKDLDDDDIKIREEWMRTNNNYAILIGSNIDSGFLPATQTDKQLAKELWSEAWKGIKNATGQDLSAQSKSKIVNLATQARQHMGYGAELS
jgi:hypothetical protein